MKRNVAVVMGYHEQPIRCCGICKYASYSKTMCKKPRDLNWNGQIEFNAAVCPTGVCDFFEIRDTEQDKAIEDAEWIP